MLLELYRSRTQVLYMQDAMHRWTCHYSHYTIYHEQQIRKSNLMLANGEGSKKRPPEADAEVGCGGSRKGGGRKQARRRLEENSVRRPKTSEGRHKSEI